MKLSRLLLLVLTVAVPAFAASVPPVIAPPKRAEALATAQSLLAARDPAVPADSHNPFFSAAFTATTGAVGPAVNDGAADGAAPATGEARPGGPRSGRDLLAAMANALKPSGYIVMGGQASLSFGQKRVKAGGTLTITFEGADYTLDVVSIDRTHFTVRLGNETYTRPIK